MSGPADPDLASLSFVFPPPPSLTPCSLRRSADYEWDLVSWCSMVYDLIVFVILFLFIPLVFFYNLFLPLAWDFTSLPLTHYTAPFIFLIHTL